MDPEKRHLANIVHRYIEVDGDKRECLKEFFSCNYTIIRMSGNGIIGYTEEEDHYFVYFAYTDKKLSNAKIVYNVAKELSVSKPVMYSGIENHFANNSSCEASKLYKMEF